VPRRPNDRQSRHEHVLVQAVVGYNTAACCVLDTETGQVVTRLDTAEDPVSGQVDRSLQHTVVNISGKTPL
jgi:hypothetical protein